MQLNKYPWQAIDPKDYIHLEAIQALSIQDVHVLTKLYQPIIGGRAFSLYMTLFANLDFNPNTKGVTVSELLRKLDVGIPDFYQARVKLEGIGLLRIYRSKEEKNEYFYKVVPPHTAKEFFGDTLLYTLLLENIGERLFKEEIETLLPESKNKEAYEETTRSFVDVYHVDLKSANVSTNTHYQVFEENDRPKLTKTIENTDSFDYDFFKGGLSRHFIRQDALVPEIKELIYTFHVVYGIDEMTMQNLILESADVESGQINKNKFTSIVQRSYLNKQRIKPTDSNTEQVLVENHLANSEQETDTATATKAGDQSGFNRFENQVINHAKQMAPANYLQSIKDQKGGFVTSNETWVLKELVESSRLSKDVINILLHYILVVKESVILEKNYAMKIANDWAQSKVRTPEDAILKVKELYNKQEEAKQQPHKQQSNFRYNNKYRQNRKKETLPDWAKDENKLKTDDDVVSQDGDALKARLDQIRKMRQQREDS